jgi:hypothetical protein
VTLTRYNANGQLDATFSGDGILTTDFGSVDAGRALELQTDGKIVIAGATGTGGSKPDFALARYLNDASVPTGSTAQFSAATFTVNEGSGGTMSGSTDIGALAGMSDGTTADAASVNITVTRTGDTTGTASVDYATANGTASDRSDYTAALGTLRFAAGETSKTINILITDDVFQEPVESFTITLSNPIGLTLGTPTTVSVSIMSNDAVTGANPVKDPTFSVEFFVRQQYADFLNREPDAAGLAFWVNQITSCGSDQQCIEVRRINVSAAFFLSNEFQQTGYLVYLFHQAAFNTSERLQFRRFLADTQEIGRGVIIEQPGTETLLEQNKQAFALSFVTRAEFLSQYPTAQTPAQFVDALSVNTGGSLSQGERDQLVSELMANNTNAGRASVLRKVAEDADFKQREFNRAFVLMQYFGYLRRNPNETPDTNFDGYNFWLAKLNQFGANFVNAELVKAFITSSEYQQRFGP